MKPAIPNLPGGNSKAAFFMRAVWFRLFGGDFPIVGLTNAKAIVKVEWTNGRYEISVTPKGGGGTSGWHKPRNGKYEVDNTYAYDEGSVIHIQPDHALVTTGIRDAANPSGGLVTSCAGFWVSTQAVPAKAVVTGNDVWNLPQYPYPVPTDMDDPTNFWIYLGEVASC